MSKLVWDKGMTARLIKAWNAGVTADVLGERFGTSGGAIIVKIGTLRASGIELRYSPSALESNRRRQLQQLRLYIVANHDGSNRGALVARGRI